MANKIPLKQLRSEQRRKRAAAAAGLALGAKKPVAAIPIASRPKRPSVGRATLPPAHYPVKKTALGKRQEAGGD
jgi:hypothetical protein